MAKSSPNHMRERIAHIAARLMAEDGISDFALAKRKAARQAGAGDTRHLPDNGEIEQALQTYQALYQGETQRAHLAFLRRQALTVMRAFAQFRPYLTGAVLSGSAGKYSGISLQLFADSAKDVEVFLLNRQIAYKCAASRISVGGEWHTVPVFVFDSAGVEVAATVFSTGDLRRPLRAAAGGKPIERASTKEVEALLGESS